MSRGNLLAGGVTYFAFFSIFPAVALAFTIFGVLLQDNQQWLDQIRDYLNDTLPGFIKDGDNEGLIPLEVPTGNTLTVTGLVGLAGLLCCRVSAGSGPCVTASARSSAPRAPPATSSPPSCVTSACSPPRVSRSSSRRR